MTKEQRDLLRIMRDGYIVCSPVTYDDKPKKYYVRRCDYPKYGHKEKVRGATMRALVRKGLLKETRRTNWIVYELTEESAE